MIELLEVLLEGGKERCFFFGEFDITEHTGEEIIEVVRDAASHAHQAFAFLFLLLFALDFLCAQLVLEAGVTEEESAFEFIDLEGFCEVGADAAAAGFFDELG